MYFLLLITTVSPQLNPSWAAVDLIHSQHISEHIIQEAWSVLKLRFYSFSQFLAQAVGPNVISKGEVLSQVCLGSILWKSQLLFAENVLTTLLHLKDVTPQRKFNTSRPHTLKAVSLCKLPVFVFSVRTLPII